MPHSQIGPSPQNIAKKLKILMILFLSLLFIVTLVYSNIRNISFSEAFLLTLETLAYDPPDNHTFGERILQVSLMIFGTFLIWFIFWSAMDFIVEGHFYNNIKRWIKMKKISSLKNHYIIYGGGRVGEHVADLLSENNVPFVIIDADKEQRKGLTKKGYLVIAESNNYDSSLMKAEVKKAKGLITVIPKTEQNLLVILTAKELNSRLNVYARSERLDLVNKLKKAGADHVVVPELAGADIIVSDLLKKKLKKHHLGE